MPKLPSTRELDQRVKQSQALSDEADRHIAASHRIRTENNFAAIVESALGLRSDSHPSVPRGRHEGC